MGDDTAAAVVQPRSMDSARLFTALTGRRSSWAVLVAAASVSAAVLLGSGEAPAPREPRVDASAADSAQVSQLQQRLPSGRVDPALVVYSRDGRPLTAADRAAVGSDVEAFAALALEGAPPLPVTAADGRATLVTVPLAAGLPDGEVTAVVDELRGIARDGLPAGATAQVTGGAGFAADLSRQFDGADVRLLLVTVGVVALLLLVTYRSPLLWLVPLLVVGVGDRVATSLLVVVDRATSLQGDPATNGIVSVLVFGAGTNYALLLIARYREELRRVENRHEAMRAALRGAAPAIAASAGTVLVSLLTLLAAVTPGTRTLGISAAIGIAVALVYALVVLPAALLVAGGRRLFWPFVPRLGQPDPTRTGFWSRVAGAVSRRPVVVTAAALLALATMAGGILGATVGLSPSEQFRTTVEADEGLDTLARHFPAGSAQPAAILTTAAAAQDVRRAAAGVAGVAEARIAERAGDLVQVDAVLDAAPGTAAAFDTVRALRRAVGTVPGSEALVGGADATSLDAREAAARDRRVVGPLVLLVVLLVLGALLRSVVAPVVLVLTVVASYLASLGASYQLFTRVLDFPALDLDVPLISFLFLVALGVDYNIFLVTRAREEAARVGTAAGIRTALAVTGGVITSAGILLAAVFACSGSFRSSP